MGRCDTEGCHREAEYVFEADTDADGEVLPEGDGLQRSFCDPCRRSAEWIQAWHPAEYTFVPINGGSQSASNSERGPE